MAGRAAARHPRSLPATVPAAVRGTGDPSRSFVGAGLVFLLAGVVLAGATRLGTHGPAGEWEAALHLFAAGWVTFLIYGVNYRTVPVFSRHRFPRPGRIALHFTLSAAGVAVSAACLATGTRGLLPALGAGAELSGALLFFANVIGLFRRRLPYTPGASEAFLLATAGGPGRGGTGPDRAATRFTRAALVYLLLALVVHGILAVRGPSAGLALAQTHLFLLGWALMMVYGVGYHLLPRLAGRAVRSTRLVRCHFALANAGTLGLALFLSGRSPWPAGLSGALAAGLYLYVWNVWPTLRSPSALPAATRSFLRAALASLAGGGALGALFAAYPPASALRPLHVALNLLGGISFLIFGTGYTLFPRLLGRASPPGAGWIGAHLALASGGLALLVAAALVGLGATPGNPWPAMLAAGGAFLYGVGVVVFAGAAWWAPWWRRPAAVPSPVPPGRHPHGHPSPREAYLPGGGEEG